MFSVVKFASSYGTRPMFGLNVIDVEGSEDASNQVTSMSQFLVFLNYFREC
jgi:hypothetical protein